MGTGISSVKVVVWDNDGGWSANERLGEVHVPTSHPGFPETVFTMTNLGQHNSRGGRVTVSASYY